MEVILEANTPIEVTNETKVIRGPRGYSSYEIAVQNGFVGSELEWLNSLVGAKGEDGKAGSPGVGIIAITKIKTEGLVDTYQIDYSNGTKSTYTITNGEKGDKGEDGLTTSITLNGETKEHVNGNIDLGNLQKPLVSGQNIKTINNQSLLGEGNIEISGGGSGGTTDYNDLSNKPITNLVGTEDNPVILLDLENGLYNISGKVKNHATDETLTTLNSVIMVKKIASNNIRYLDLNPKNSNNGTFLSIYNVKYTEEAGVVVEYSKLMNKPYFEAVINYMLSNTIATAYDDTKTYSVGSYVTYVTALWKCKTDITTAEKFDSTKWEQVNIIDVIDSKISTAIGNALKGSY